MPKIENPQVKHLTQYLQGLSAHQSALFLSAIGALLASWVIYIQHGWINDDSVLYFEAARLFSIGEWKAGIELYSWPLYSLLIAGLHKLTTLSFQFCAQILTVVFFALTTYSLLRIITLAGGEKVTIVLGALLLFSTFYITGDVLAMLLRDPGFWACILTACVFFIQFYRQHKLKDALYWQVFAIFAMLFRIEAATYIALLPLILFLSPNATIKNKVIFFIKAHALNLALFVLASIALLLHGDLSIEKLGRLQEIVSSWSDIQANFNYTISIKVQALATSVLGEPLQGYAWMSLILSLIAIASIKSISVAGWLPVLLIVSYYNNVKQNMAEDVRLILYATALLAFINAMLIIFKVNILPSRYVIIFGFVMLIFAAFSLSDVLKKWQLKSSQWDKIILFIAMVIIGFSLITNVLPKKPGYNYEQDAVAYLKQHGIKNNQVFFVTPRARYYAEAPYAGRGYDYWEYTKQAIENGSILDHQYLMIPLKKNLEAVDKEHFIREKLPQYQIVKTFYSERNKKKVVIYKRN